MTLRLFGFVPDLPSMRPPEEVELCLVHHGLARGGHRERPAWCVDRGEAWRQADGDRMPKSPHDVVAERRVVRGGDWSSVPWGHTDVVDPCRVTGWLSPDGVWFGCAPVWHERVALLVFGVEASELHRTFARVRDVGYASPPTLTGRLTPAQAAWLRSRGHGGADEAASARAEVERAAAASGRPLRRRGSGD